MTFEDAYDDRGSEDGARRVGAVTRGHGRPGDAGAAVRTPPGGPSREAGDPHGAGPVRVGELLGGRYRIGRRIGAGGMATIYRATDEVLERPVAVKVLHAHLADDEELQARFRTEGRHAAALAHPHIVGVYDQGVADLPYLVMELVDGPSLRDVLAARGPLSPGEALAVVGPVATALDRAHRTGLVHRDIKPENVLVDGEEGTPKVADFGIARVVAGTSHTQTGALIGSVHYMAPELVDGHEATPASDQYALAVLTYELLTGQRPFAGDSPMAVALRHARDRVPAPSDLAPRVPAEVDAVVRRATAHDPDERFADLGAFASALHAAVPGGAEPVVVHHAGHGGVEHTLVIPAASQETTALEEGNGRPAPATPPLPARRRPTGSPERPAPSPDVGADPAGDDGDGHTARRPRRRLLLAAVALVLLGGIAGGGAWAYWNFILAPVTAVPDLVGLSEADAEAAAEEVGLELVVAGERHDLLTEPGEVLGQDPAEGEERRAGDRVAVALSLGPRPVEMPDVGGLPVEEAAEVLEGERLVVTRSEEHSDDVAEGAVIDQEPEAGSALHEGDEVALVVSLGVEQVEVPDLRGRQLSEVEDLLAEAGLDLAEEPTRVWSDEVPTEGEVIDQAVAPGEEVDLGSAVAVTASLGPRTIETPDVRADPVEDARDLLESRGLEVAVDASPRPTLGPFVRGSVGLVEEQLPGPGETIARGETVTLYTYTDDG
ncbi:MAG: PASTA domain-containing protein [Egibacteraceae bacterium]